MDSDDEPAPAVLPRRQMLFTVSQVAKLLHRSPKSVYRYARSGDLPMYKIGGQWVMNRADLMTLLGRVALDDLASLGEDTTTWDRARWS